MPRRTAGRTGRAGSTRSAAARRRTRGRVPGDVQLSALVGQVGHPEHQQQRAGRTHRVDRPDHLVEAGELTELALRSWRWHPHDEQRTLSDGLAGQGDRIRRPLVDPALPVRRTQAHCRDRTPRCSRRHCPARHSGSAPAAPAPRRKPGRRSRRRRRPTAPPEHRPHRWRSSAAEVGTTPRPDRRGWGSEPGCRCRAVPTRRRGRYVTSPTACSSGRCSTGPASPTGAVWHQA